jgi:hypothetical protein
MPPRFRYEVRAAVIQEAPRTDKAALLLGKSATDRHGARTAKGNFPRNQELYLVGASTLGADDFFRDCFEVTHNRVPLALLGRGSWHLSAGAGPGRAGADRMVAEDGDAVEGVHGDRAPLQRRELRVGEDGAGCGQLLGNLPLIMPGSDLSRKNEPARL